MTRNEEMANRLYIKMMNVDRPLTKVEIGAYLGISASGSNERTIRKIISLLAQKRPIIATSDNKGYRLAKTVEDVADVMHQWKELDSRIEEIEKRKKPLVEFYSKVKGFGSEIEKGGDEK